MSRLSRQQQCSILDSFPFPVGKRQNELYSKNMNGEWVIIVKLLYSALRISLTSDRKAMFVQRVDGCGFCHMRGFWSNFFVL